MRVRVSLPVILDGQNMTARVEGAITGFAIVVPESDSVPKVIAFALSFGVASKIARLFDDMQARVVPAHLEAIP